MIRTKQCFMGFLKKKQDSLVNHSLLYRGNLPEKKDSNRLSRDQTRSLDFAQGSA